MTKTLKPRKGWILGRPPKCENCNEPAIASANLDINDLWNLDWWCGNCDHYSGHGIDWPFGVDEVAFDDDLRDLGFEVDGFTKQDLEDMRSD